MASPYAITPDRAYHSGSYSIAKLLRDGLWDIREKYINVNDLPRELLRCLKSRKYYRCHGSFQKLYDISTSSKRAIEKDDCDIIVLYYILRHICTSLKAPRHGWGSNTKPSASNIEIADDIERIRIGHKTFLHKGKKVSMSKDYFETLVAEIRAIVSRVDMFLNSNKYMAGLDQIEVDCKVLSKVKENVLEERLKYERGNRVEIAEVKKESNDTKQKLGRRYKGIAEVKDESNENTHTLERHEKGIAKVTKESNENKEEHAKIITSGPTLPIEILRMDAKAVELYKMALEEGEEVDHSIRIMIIGHFGVGKTTLKHRLLGEPVDIKANDSTNGIDVDMCRCKVLLSDQTWHSLQPDEKSDTALKRLAKMIASRSTGEDAPTPADEEILKTSAAKPESLVRAVDSAKQSVDVQGDEMLNIGENTQSISKPLYDKEEQEEDEDTACIEEMKALVAELTETGTFDPGEFANVSLWDFAGQYVFYTTHQMFMSPRVVYLLVTDISKHIGNVVEDDGCYIDSSGLKQCTISEFVDLWLNSIHTCSPDGPGDESTVPSVILVGTHADKLQEAIVTDDADFCQRGENRDKRASDYFKDIRKHLCEKPTRFHLANKDFDIDNTDEHDSKLEDLKEKIVEVAQRQTHWGQRIPAKWLRLETALCGLKETGLKIVDFVRIEELNLAMSVPISTTKELKLFLKFHHESGNILYFSEGSLQEKVVLDSQWLVDALNSLITTKMMCYRNYPHVTKEWNEFDSNGILRPQLLDALWQKDNNPSFHDNRAHLLALMEKMNLISRPMVWHKDDATPTKEEYHLVPCMLKDKPGKYLLSPGHGKECETTSILVFYFQREFVPTAVFHRLLAACLSKWSLWRDGDSDLIFCGCGVFQIDQSHKLTLVFRDFTIQAFVTKYGLREKSPRKEICIAVLEFLDESLKFVTGSMATFSLYDLRIKCPKNKSNSVDAIIPVSVLQNNNEYVCSCHAGKTPHVFNSVDILKYWFPCKSDSVTADLNTCHIIDGKAYQSCLSTERLRTMPTEKDMSNIAQRIVVEYKQLGLQLGLTEAEIAHIRIDNPHHITDVLFTILLTWERKVGNATFCCLENAMRAAGIKPEEVFKDIDSW